MAAGSAGRNHASRLRRAAPAPLADPTATQPVLLRAIVASLKRDPAPHGCDSRRAGANEHRASAALCQLPAPMPRSCKRSGRWGGPPRPQGEANDAPSCQRFSLGQQASALAAVHRPTADDTAQMDEEGQRVGVRRCPTSALRLGGGPGRDRSDAFYAAIVARSIRSASSSSARRRRAAAIRRTRRRPTSAGPRS